MFIYCILPFCCCLHKALVCKISPCTSSHGGRSSLSSGKHRSTRREVLRDTSKDLLCPLPQALGPCAAVVGPAVAPDHRAPPRALSTQPAGRPIPRETSGN